MRENWLSNVWSAALIRSVHGNGIFVFRPPLTKSSAVSLKYPLWYVGRTVMKEWGMKFPSRKMKYSILLFQKWYLSYKFLYIYAFIEKLTLHIYSSRVFKFSNGSLYSFSSDPISSFAPQKPRFQLQLLSPYLI